MLLSKLRVTGGRKSMLATPSSTKQSLRSPHMRASCVLRLSIFRREKTVSYNLKKNSNLKLQRQRASSLKKKRRSCKSNSSLKTRGNYSKTIKSASRKRLMTTTCLLSKASRSCTLSSLKLKSHHCKPWGWKYRRSNWRLGSLKAAASRLMRLMKRTGSSLKHLSATWSVWSDRLILRKKLSWWNRRRSWKVWRKWWRLSSNRTKNELNLISSDSSLAPLNRTCKHRQQLLCKLIHLIER
jgi:hypothetical protein